MDLLLVDIGNTHIHYTVSGEAPALPNPQTWPTAKLLAGKIPPEWQASTLTLKGIAYCTVVPKAERMIEDFHQNHHPNGLLMRLTPETFPGIPLAYPNPLEIGPDRLANAVSAYHDFALPAVVIDLGTAVTFDIITRQGGYEGGIIAPGIGLMTRYLHQQTALLPQLKEPFTYASAIGTSTREAMSIGCVVGFRGTIRALLQEVSEELDRRKTPLQSLIFTGGTGFLFANEEEMNKTHQSLVPKADSPKITHSPFLTLRGLQLTFDYHHSDRNK
ncbi:MAG: type III pantothenate kinase [Opitutales bacterium]|nr:type III pantothenate kinase [Opitutales bacterium]MCH8540747.1 type III pantothenate kinase [Opitutales bacterium]